MPRAPKGLDGRVPREAPPGRTQRRCLASSSSFHSAHALHATPRGSARSHPVQAQQGNLVVPQPSTASAEPPDKPPLASLASSKSVDGRPAGGGGPPRPLVRSHTATARSGKRATFAVANSSGGDGLALFAGASTPAAAAAAFLASSAASQAGVDRATGVLPSSTPLATQPSVKGRHMSVRPELTRVGSVQRLLDRRRGGKKAVSVTLDVLLKDERARVGFFRYLEATSTLSGDEEPAQDPSAAPPGKLKRRASRLARVTVDYREDCVLFWLEISDLLKIPSGGSFHLGLMQDLFDVYVAKGAARLLPMVSSAEREPLAQFLADRNADRALLAFKMLLLDVLEVVTAAFDEYVRCDTKLGYDHATRSESMRNVLERLVKSNLGAASHDRRAQLHEILNMPPLCRMFREFLQERNSIENLLFIVDALVFEDLVNSFDAEAQEKPVSEADAASRNEYCLRQAQKIFNKFIRYGSKAEICLSGAVKAKLLQSVVEYPLSAQVFNDAVLLCSAELVQSHLDVFYRSRAFLDFQLARQEAAKAARTASSAHGRRTSSAPVDATASTGALVGGVSAQPVELDAPTLSEILNGVGANFFRDFLKQEGLENTLLFYKEVEQFQLLPHGQKHYIQIKARRIFDRFVRRGGKLEIELPPDVRRDILFKLSSPSEFTFMDALKYVLNLWEATYLPKFRSHPRYKDMRAAMDASTPAQAAPPGTTVVEAVRRRESTLAGVVAGDATQSAGAPTSNAHTAHGDAVDVSKIALREFLELEFLRKYFRHFLEKEQCLNELHFYFEIATFQQLPTSDYLTRQAKKLYNRFCDPQSRECVVLREDLKLDLQASLARPSPAMFRKTQDEIFGFFQSTLFPKFQQSEVYRTIQITNAQLRNARKSALGALDRDDANGGRPHSTASGTDGTTATSAGDAPARLGARRSVSTLAAVPELSEDLVSVAMILEHQDTRSLFLLFAEEIFCTESIYFWLDCNEYKDIPHRNYLKLRAQKIYRKYICGRAKLQVNLESTIVKEIVKNLDDPARTLFMAAQKSITKMLERDTLPKFRKSKHYQPCLQILRSALIKTRT